MHNHIPLSFIVTAKQAGVRLDVVLGSALPHTGIRARRRLWSWCTICVNGKPQLPGYAVKVGDSIFIEEMKIPFSSSVELSSTEMCFEDMNKDTSTSHISSSTLPHYSKNMPSLLEIFEDFVLFYKPSEMHTASISGKKTDSLESLLSELWQPKKKIHTSNVSLFLLTRLDYLTSGIIIAAKNREAQKKFRQWENQGYVEKSYFSVVEGHIAKPFSIKNALDTSKRIKTRVLEGEGESTRWSSVVPLREMSKEEILQFPYTLKGNSSCNTYESLQRESNSTVKATLINVHIHRGARHQIRAHLAHAGYPLLGDPLYGYGQEELPFLLHHGIVVTPEFSYKILPDWLNER